jgi:putative ABC transport system permease protein
MKFICDKDLVFNKNQLVGLGVHRGQGIFPGYQNFANELSNSQLISGVTRANTTVGSGMGNSLATGEYVDGKKVHTMIYRLRVDHDFPDVYQIKLLAGRNFRTDNASDSTTSFIVNGQCPKLNASRVTSVSEV